MNRIFRVCLLLMLPLLLAQVAAADSFTFSFFGSAGSNATGYVVANSLGGNQYLAVSGWLNVTSGAGAGLYSLLIPGGPTIFYSPSGSFYVDDIFYDPGNPFVDDAGLLFSDGTREANFWGVGPDVYELGVWDPKIGTYSVLETGKGTATHGVPEPSSLILTGLGVLAAGLIQRRQRAG
jgi:hypothetical protein